MNMDIYTLFTRIHDLYLTESYDDQRNKHLNFTLQNVTSRDGYEYG